MFSTTNVLARTHKESGNKNEDMQNEYDGDILCTLSSSCGKFENKNKTDKQNFRPVTLSLCLESKISLDFKTLIPHYQLFEPHLTSVSLVFVKFLISAASWTRILKDLMCHLEWSLRFELTGQEWWPTVRQQTFFANSTLSSSENIKKSTML